MVCYWNDSSRTVTYYLAVSVRNIATGWCCAFWARNTMDQCDFAPIMPVFRLGDQIQCLAVYKLMSSVLGAWDICCIICIAARLKVLCQSNFHFFQPAKYQILKTGLSSTFQPNLPPTYLLTWTCIKGMSSYVQCTPDHLILLQIDN